jgi:hypothetical protein
MRFARVVEIRGETMQGFDQVSSFVGQEERLACVRNTRPGRA